MSLLVRPLPVPRLRCIGSWASSNRDGAIVSLAQAHRKGDWADLCLTILQEVHLATVIEILQSIRQADMSPILSQIYSAPGGTQALDVLMKYMYAPPPKTDTSLFRAAFRAVFPAVT